MTKNETIKQTMRETKDRRSEMDCRVYVVKVVANKLSREKKEHFDLLFREAKYLRNAVLAADDIFHFDRNVKAVMVKVGDVFEERVLSVLGSQMKQDLVDMVQSEIKGLATKKKNGEKVGRLRFKPYCNCIPLRQYGVTYRVDFEKNTISIQNLRKPVKVRGLSQIPKETELASARLVRKPSGLYFHITTYCPKEPVVPTGHEVGIDFGIQHHMTLSTGETIDLSVAETAAVKRNSRKVNKALRKNGRKKGANHRKRVLQLQRAFERQNNKKSDKAKKEVSRLLRENDLIAIQDEMIADWHKGLFGAEVQHSAMGFIKARLKTSPKTHVVPKEFPSTQRCPVCEENTKHPLNARHYHCEHCGYHHPNRDIKSAEMILMEAKRTVT